MTSLEARCASRRTFIGRELTTVATRLPERGVSTLLKRVECSCESCASPCTFEPCALEPCALEPCALPRASCFAAATNAGSSAAGASVDTGACAAVGASAAPKLSTAAGRAAVAGAVSWCNSPTCFASLPIACGRLRAESRGDARLPSSRLGVCTCLMRLWGILPSAGRQRGQRHSHWHLVQAISQEQQNKEGIRFRFTLPPTHLHARTTHPKTEKSKDSGSG